MAERVTSGLAGEPVGVAVPEVTGGAAGVTGSLGRGRITIAGAEKRPLTDPVATLSESSGVSGPSGTRRAAASLPIRMSALERRSPKRVASSRLQLIGCASRSAIHCDASVNGVDTVAPTSVSQSEDS